ncbi:MAG TPA: rhodanese-like domain-containing protein [Rhodopila sp.]|uniref:rhodanese-like domain-containing protein n=1 Tax=Rhodopila sp. TaxID=2480087 RepID=UPI002B9E22B2|nr:rhodanese-like domain-containing protein [Rhodopila sp.]HVY16108.1 rhodanese-like domain-containing protein [Rhodopila sp.]
MSLMNRLFGKTPAEQEGWIDVPDLAAMLKDGTPPSVIDVRNPDEFTGPLGHIDGARNIPLPAFEGHIPELARQAGSVVLVCHTDRRSAMAATALRKAGKQQALVLRGGMTAWRAKLGY